mmetsp:Transcript_3622/g.10652  ORF Transcript_3622/g.10652 Transcript_3622/m.10652 type:complete len:233 (+) Transcript_3622:575-1273(+)
MRLLDRDRQVRHEQVARGDDQPLPRRGRVQHRLDVRLRDVLHAADVHADGGHGGHRALENALRHGGRRWRARQQQRPVDKGRVDGGHLEAESASKRPRSLFGSRLADGVRRRHGLWRPVLSRERPARSSLGLVLRAADRGHTRREDDPLHACGGRRTQHLGGALESSPHLVVSHIATWEGRRNVSEVGAARHRRDQLRLAVVEEIDLHDLEPREHLVDAMRCAAHRASDREA